uniref:Uncharacterized protein n=1 Tax=Cannabis sativa TaxID=3483 RepID=A0A803PDG7_CANSA
MGNQPQFDNQIRSPQFSTIVTVHSSGSYNFAALSEQFQKFIASQPNAMYVSSLVGQPPTCTSGSTTSEANWDQP